MSALPISTERWSQDASDAQSAASGAYSRLLHFAEREGSHQNKRVAVFLVGTYAGKAFPFDLQGLWMVDAEVSRDMLTCLDALRWGQVELHRLVDDGERRLHTLIDRWELGPVSGLGIAA